MQQQDYLQRQIEELGRVLGKILADLVGLKTQGKVGEGIEVTDEALNGKLDLDLATLTAVPANELIDALADHNPLYKKQLEPLASLAFELATGFDVQGASAPATAWYEKALVLYEHLDREGGVFSFDRQYKIEQLTTRLRQRPQAASDTEEVPRPAEPQNRQPPAPPTWSLLLALAFLTACFGPADNSPQERVTLARASVAQDTLPTAGMEHLFFLDGQLCAWVRQIFQDRRGDLWIGTNHYGVMRYANDTLTYHTDTEGLAAGRITGIVEDAAGNVWIGTQRGLTKYDGTTFTNYDEQDGLSDSEIWSLLLDREGGFWIGTTTGVFRFDGEQFTPFPIPKTAVRDTNTILSYDRITSILEDRNGSIWFGTDGFGICRYDGTTFSHLTRANGLADDNIAALLEDRRGNIWIGTMFGGISRYDGRTFTNYTQDGAVRGEEVYGLYEDPAGNIWFSAEGQGIYRYNGNSFRGFTAEDGLESSGIQCFYADREGRFWLGGWGGLFRSDGDTFTPVTREGPWE